MKATIIVLTLGTLVLAGCQSMPAPEKPAAEAPKPAPRPEPTLKATIDLSAQRITVSERGDQLYSWPISSGTAEHPTPRGTFYPQWTAKMWYSRKYDNAPMPNAVFISGGVAIHATYATSMLGRPASHGCIRLAPTNAATFYKLVQKHGLKNVRVSVYGTPKWSAPAVARRDNGRTTRYVAAAPSSGWKFFWDDEPTYRKPVYRATSAYDPRFVKPKRRAPNVIYTMNGERIYYRRPQNPRTVYRMPPRRYYTGYGYGLDW